MDSTFASWLAYHRTRLEITAHGEFREHLAARGPDVSVTTIKNWMLGVRLPRAHHLVLLFDLFAVPLAERQRVAEMVIRERAAMHEDAA